MAQHAHAATHACATPASMSQAYAKHNAMQAPFRSSPLRPSYATHPTHLHEPSCHHRPRADSQHHRYTAQACSHQDGTCSCQAGQVPVCKVCCCWDQGQRHRHVDKRHACGLQHCAGGRRGCCGWWRGGFSLKSGLRQAPVCEVCCCWDQG